MSTQSVLLQACTISKTFPGVTALKRVDFRLERGEIHALMGENGAGKSTLIKILTGVEQPDSGTLLLNDEPINPRSPQHAQQLGISTVYQEVNLCPNLSVAENMFIGRMPRRLGMVDWKQMYQRAAAALAKLGIAIDVREALSSYSVAIQQMVAIARALDVSAQVLILDEPTASLDAREVEELFQVLHQLKAQGLGVIFITHFLEQVYAVCDRISVLRNGEMIGTYSTASLPRLELVAKMIGKDLDTLDQLQDQKGDAEERTSSEALLKVRKLGKAGVLQPLDFELHKGEVLGLAGLLGSGRTETARLLFGVDQADQGNVQIGATTFNKRSPRQSLHQGMGMCPENRRADGIIPDLTVRENIILALQARMGWRNSLGTQEQQALAERYIRALNIKTSDADQPVKNLSGGNQQKVILARWLATDPTILILDEPTRGIDIGAKTEIQKLVLRLAEEGKAVLFISSELDEVLRCSHRVVVLRDRQKVAELSGSELDETWVMQAIAERQADDIVNS